MIDIQTWKSTKYGELINDIKKLLIGRKGYSCNHCDRQYDDDICTNCFAKMLVDRFQETIYIKDKSDEKVK